MCKATIMALILAISAEYEIPPYFSLAVALTENSTLNPNAISPPNRNGTVDRGIFQLNENYFYGFDWACPKTNIRKGIRHIRALTMKRGVYTWFSVAISYNAGWSRLNNPPASTINYAVNVMRRWRELDPMGFHEVILRRGKW